MKRLSIVVTMILLFSAMVTFAQETTVTHYDRYWSELIKTDIEQIKKFTDLSALTSEQRIKISDMCYTDVFLHSDDTANIAMAVRWLSIIVDNRYPFDPDALDTYACLLYKAGKKEDALAVERKYLKWCSDNKARGTDIRTQHVALTIEKMTNGEKIWLEKEFQ